MVRCTCAARPLLVKKIEHGGILLRGNAPTLHIEEGRLVVFQRCPNCKRMTKYIPMTLKLQGNTEATHAPTSK